MSDMSELRFDNVRPPCYDLYIKKRKGNTMNLDEYKAFVENKRMVSKMFAMSALSATIPTNNDNESENN